MKDQASTYFPTSTSPVEVFANENDLDKSQNTKFKKKNQNLTKELKEFEEDT